MTAETSVEHELPAARNKLHDAISNLIDPRPERLDNQTHWLNPRYHELREAISSHGGASGGHKPQSQAPAWVDAIMVAEKIDKRCRQLVPETPILECDDYATVQRLRIYSIRKWRPQDTPLVLTAAIDLEKFIVDIDELFAPKPKDLPDKCPRCNVARVPREIDDPTTDSGKATIRIAALQITATGCTCNNCGQHWPPSKLMFLGLLLGYRIQGVIE